VTAGFEIEPAPALLPGRFRKAMVHTVDDLMPGAWMQSLGAWLAVHRERFERGGDANGARRFNWELLRFDEHAADLAAQLRARLVEAYPAALAACCVPEFDLQSVEQTATLYHHGSHFDWHDDGPGYDGTFAPTRRMAFAYYLHTPAKMFTGGELEFMDGTAVEPRCNRVAFFHPLQQHRVRLVECWSADPLHGRWAVMGWLHGDPPPGWLERVPFLRR